MLVIGVRAATPSSDDLAWSGRRHDDDNPGAVRGSSSADLFDAVFHALHDGEQVAVGFAGPLTTRVDENQRNLDGAGQEDQAIALLDEAEAAAPGLAGLDRLLGELGKWRPWTAVSTSLPRWRATTSILVWELLPSSNAAGEDESLATDTPDLESTVADSGVRGFYELLRTRAAASRRRRRTSDQLGCCGSTPGRTAGRCEAVIRAGADDRRNTAPGE